MVGLGEGGDTTAGRAKLVGVRLGYATKNFGVSAATTQSENSLTTLGKHSAVAVCGRLDGQMDMLPKPAAGRC